MAYTSFNRLYDSDVNVSELVLWLFSVKVQVDKICAKETTNRWVGELIIGCLTADGRGMFLEDPVGKSKSAF